MLSKLPLLAALAACRTPPAVDALLISLDGTSPALLSEELDDLPALSALAEGGQYLDLRVEGTTITKPAHALMLSGYPEAVTGVGSPLDGGGDAPLAEGLSVFERIGERSPGVHQMFVAAKPTMLPIWEEGDTFYYAARACAVAENEEALTARSGDLMIAALEQADPSQDLFGFFHFGRADYVGHQSGERSEEQREELRAIDDQIRRIQAWLAANGREDALLYVTSDHGFTPDSTTHQTDADGVWLLSNDPQPLSGSLLRQVPWTILERYGIDPERMDPPPDIEPL